MKVYISVDMEGIAGVVSMDQVIPRGQDFLRGRELMTEEANAAALGAFDAGATAVLLNDSHGDMRNLLFEKLDPRVEVISGDLKPLSMVQGVETGCDAAIFVGYHPGMGARAGVMSHTYSCGFAEVRVNGRVLNETGLNALVCGFYGTPVVLVTGDELCCEEARAVLGEVETVTVKWGISNACARSLHPVEARRRIREAAKRAVEGRARFRPFRMGPPYELRIRFQDGGMADGAEMMPGVVRVDALTVGFTAANAPDVPRAVDALAVLADVGISRVRPK